MDFMNKKQILRAVTNELPSLFEFEKASIYMHDPASKSLFSITLDEEAERIMRERYKTFEVEFAMDSKQIVRFPMSMGVAGFCYTANAVAYFNGGVNLSGVGR